MSNLRLFEDDVPNEDSIYQERLNGQWVYTVALREALSIARRGNTPTYAETLVIANKLAGEILGRQHLLFSPGESKEAQKFRDKARLRSKQGKDELLKNKKKGEKISPEEEEATLVTAIQVVDSEIDELANLLKVENGQYSVLRTDLENLRKVRDELAEREAAPRDEPEIIFKDWNMGLELPISRRGEGYHDFALPNNRIMRIRMLHASKAEAITGVDLLYEYHQPEQEKARLAAVQYKIPKAKDKGLTMYADIKRQLERLDAAFCNKELCGVLSSVDKTYRLSSHYMAFLRPTDKIQKFDPRIATTGYHLRVCDVLDCDEKTREGTPRLSYEIMREQGISSRIFEELFNTNRLGSRWIAYQDLENLHHEYKITNPYEQASIHIQEVPVAV